MQGHGNIHFHIQSTNTPIFLDHPLGALRQTSINIRLQLIVLKKLRIKYNSSQMCLSAHLRRI